MKIELSIKVDYLPSWGTYEGLRELIQNGKDAETEFNAKLEVRHRKDTSTLVIENEGCTIPHEALLFGHTSKSQRSDMIGKFGEGLKLGVLALVRSGCEVKIRSGSEVWIPKIEKSEKFSANVLTFYIEKGRLDKDRVQIEISGIQFEDWKALKERFLFLCAPEKDAQVRTRYGSLLLGPKYTGKVFVKGIFVELDPKLKFGYDLTEGVDIDRDRKMVSRWDLNWRTHSIWNEALSISPDLLTPKFAELLEEQAEDVTHISESSAGALPEIVKAHMANAFTARHGADAVPVASLADSRDIEHLGKKGVVVNPTLRAVLQATMGSTQKVMEDLKNEATKTYSWFELSSEEREVLKKTIGLVNEVEPITLDYVDIVDFRSPTLLGMYKEHRVLLAKKHLQNKQETLATLIHEVAHRGGGDGDKGHIENLERIWSGVVKLLWK